jgi:periplasmic divalent cation tolerance protein
MAVLKTSRTQYPHLELRLRALHSYDVPEVVAVALAEGSNDYLRWVQASLQLPTEGGDPK